MPSNVVSALPEAAQVKSNYLFELIVRDAQSSAMQIGGVSALLSHHVQSGATSLGALRHFLNDDTRVSQLALRYARDAGLSADLTNALQALYISVATAQGELSRLTKAGVNAESVAASGVRWRRIASAARIVLGQLQEPTLRRLDAVFAEDSKTLQAFLQKVAEGGAARFDASGVLMAPVLRQRRQSARLELRQPCEIAYGGGVVRAEITNISATGMGLRCPTEIALDRDIEICLPDGRRLSARVMHWADGVIGARHNRFLTNAEILAFSKPCP